MTAAFPKKAVLVLILASIMHPWSELQRNVHVVVALSTSPNIQHSRPLTGTPSVQAPCFHRRTKFPHSKNFQQDRQSRQRNSCRDDAATASHMHDMSRGRFLLSMATIAMTPLVAKGESAIASGVPSSSFLPKDTQQVNVADLSSKLPTCIISADVEKLTSTLTESFSGFVAGGALTLAKTVIKYPLDTATVRLQMPGSVYSMARPNQLFEDSFRGISTPLLSNIPAGAVFFAVKDATKQALKQYTSGTMPKWLSTSLAVAVAQGPYWMVRNPSEVVKTRQQAGITGYGPDKTAIDAFRKIWEEESLSGLYSGFWENVVYAYPADVIKFVCYDALSGGKSNLSPAEGALYGSMSTAVAQLITTPLDVVRNRVMASSGYGDQKTGAETSPKHMGERNSYLGSIAKLGQEEGLDGLFAGAAPRVGKALLSGAIQFATYEKTKASIAKWSFNK